MSVYLAAARRSAVVPRGTAFAHLGLGELAGPVIAALLQDAGLEAHDIDEIILSNALGAGGNPARFVALAAGLPERVAGLSIDRQCVGGLDAIRLGAAMISAGQCRAVIAGGVESYSQRPIRMRPGPNGGAPVAYDQPPFTPWPDKDPDMAEAAAALAIKLGISRAAQDEWAMASHRAALAARGELAGEDIVPIGGVDHDTFARALGPALCRRAPVIVGSITHANAAVAADAAAFCLLMSDDLAARTKLPLVRVGAGETLGADPSLPGLAPVLAIQAALAEDRRSAGDIDLFEVMEAYAVQAMAVCQLAGLARDRVNLKGGALARGHPVGASGAILAVRLFHALKNTGKSGLAAIAAAGGLGTAQIFTGCR